jgi:dTDP-4-amino-4,6-dideoxygalactose transaminase
MLDTPFSPWPCYTEEEIAAVVHVLASNRVNYWTGEECLKFEKEFATWTGSAHAIAVANGTVALDLALRGLGIGPGDEVVVTPRTFLASVSCVINAGARPVFADVHPDSGNVDANTIRTVLSPRTRAVIVVHLAGWPCDMGPIMELSEIYGFKVIEDCAQAHGARYQGRSVGSIGHVGAWSFCQDKIMTTGGEGGMVTTNDRDLWSRMWAFKDHGKSWEAIYKREHPPGFKWVHDSFGTNWRMIEMQAVIGRIQLTRMAEWTARRNFNAAAVARALRPYSDAGGVIRLPEFRCGSCPAVTGTACQAGCVHARYKFYAYVRSEALRPNWSRDRIVDEITARGVPCYQGSCSEVYLERAFDSTDVRPPERLAVARALGDNSLMWLVHPTLTEDEIGKCCRVTAEVLSEAMESSQAACRP